MRRLLPLTALIALAAAPATAQTPADPGEAIFARQILMSEIETQMVPIDLAAVGEDFDLKSAQPRASAISAMLGASPFLYLEGTDQDATADSDFPSTAMPAVWENFPAFKAMADQAAQMAFDLSLQNDEDAFREQAAALRAVCNACHAAYMAPYESPF